MSSKGVNYLLSFIPGSTNPELLERTLTGRKDLVDNLEELVLDSIKSGNKHQRLIIGPRGSGKTHVLRVLHDRLNKRADLKDKLEIAYLIEEEYGVATFLDWIIRILRSFIRWSPEKASYLEGEIEKLKDTPPADREKIASHVLLNYFQGKTLLIIVENLDSIFNEKQGFGKEGQAKFRDLIQQNSSITIMASSQALFQDIESEDKPFHNFFKISHMRKLTLEEAMGFLKSIAEVDGNTDLSNFLENGDGKSRISAIYDLIGGNHRLLVTFYKFLKTDYIGKLSESFMKTVNDLIPFYQNMMDLLASQQQKIVQYLCQVREASTGKDIARNCFIDPNTLSKQMSNLVRLKYVEAYSGGRETYYELSEPLLRICYEVKENRGGPIKLFIDFLGNLYSFEEIKKKYMYSRKHPNIEPSLISSGSGQDILSLTEASTYYFPGKFEQFKILEIAKNNDLIIQSFEEELTTLFIHGSHQNISLYLKEVLELIGTYKCSDQFFKAVPQSLFEILVQHEKIDTQRFEFIQAILTEMFKENESMIMPLKFLDIGIRHLKKKERNVLFHFTKEERNTFKKFVLEKINPSPGK